ncbi:cupin domain-containing protein [Bacillus sp. NEB1478]|uniref:cupin domain-containing protein n=1 Tax=Bacillus sp. NEB1478 TaxID=3073816 RepID=UPI002873CEA0|nr:cupin domain-containing protein [Bacillus sp. NEB1478]WNB90845.1 cupin domain-containing protein [Bacillus sp. NEB1478]
MKTLNEDVKTLFFSDDGKIPNHPSWPVLLYVGALNEVPEDALNVFEVNGWSNGWENGVFDYHHYHSNTHEVLAVISGEAVIQLGGEEGVPLEISEGDVIILPAGTGHKKISASNDFKVAGAYPNGMEHDLKKGLADDRPEVLDNIMLVPFPDTDPVFGKEGPMFELWKS